MQYEFDHVKPNEGNHANDEAATASRQHKHIRFHVALGRKPKTEQQLQIKQRQSNPHAMLLAANYLLC